MKPSALDVFLHTNRADAWNEPPAKTLYRAHAGWASEQITVGAPARRVVINVTAQREALECCYRAPWSANACYKYDWMLEAWRRGSQGPQQRDSLQGQQQQHSRTASSLALLSDTDVIFQCDADELQERFRTRFGGAPLVVGGERKWYPLPRDAHDPFGPDPRLPWKVKYTARRARQYYPNSGLVMGALARLDDLIAIQLGSRDGCARES